MGIPHRRPFSGHYQAVLRAWRAILVSAFTDLRDVQMSSMADVNEGRMSLDLFGFFFRLSLMLVSRLSV